MCYYDITLCIFPPFFPSVNFAGRIIQLNSTIEQQHNFHGRERQGESIGKWKKGSRFTPFTIFSQHTINYYVSNKYTWIMKNTCKMADESFPFAGNKMAFSSAIIRLQQNGRLLFDRWVKCKGRVVRGSGRRQRKRTKGRQSFYRNCSSLGTFLVTFVGKIFTSIIILIITIRTRKTLENIYGKFLLQFKYYSLNVGIKDIEV